VKQGALVELALERVLCSFDRRGIPTGGAFFIGAEADSRLDACRSRGPRQADAAIAAIANNGNSRRKLRACPLRAASFIALAS